MWRLIIVALMLSTTAQASSGCKPSESSRSAVRRSTEIVQSLPELAGWSTLPGKVVFDTGSRERVGRWCYETVYVSVVNPDKDLDLQHVFAVHLPTKTILVMDMPSAEFITLKKWRASKAHGNEP